jgi:hypothetical protein
MRRTKKRHVIFYSLVENHGQEQFFIPDTINELIEYIKNHTKINRRYTINTDKFCLLESGTFNHEQNCYELLFKSARHSFSPPLINRRTVAERANPKEMDEGEIEKVHAILRTTKDDVILCIEKNKNGISINNFLSYLNYFLRKKLAEDNEEEEFHYSADIIAKDNFLTLLRSMSRVSVAEVYYDKSILGGHFLNLSDRSIGIRNSVVVSIKPVWGESAKELAIDAFNKYNGARGQNPIQKIRLEGKNEMNGDVVLNTDFIEKRDTIDVEYDQNTGETSTRDSFRKITALANL